MIRCFILSFFVVCTIAATAQEREVTSSSATDASVRIDKRKRLGMTAPPKDRSRYVQKNRAATVEVRDRSPKVVEFSSKRQKKTSRARVKSK